MKNSTPGTWLAGGQTDLQRNVLGEFMLLLSLIFLYNISGNHKKCQRQQGGDSNPIFIEYTTVALSLFTHSPKWTHKGIGTEVVNFIAKLIFSCEKI